MFTYVAFVLAPAVILAFKVPKVGVIVALTYLYVMSKLLVEAQFVH